MYHERRRARAGLAFDASEGGRVFKNDAFMFKNDAFMSPCS